MVYVLDKNGQPLSTTTRHGHVRKMLKEGKAKVVGSCPFTIQLLEDDNVLGGTTMEQNDNKKVKVIDSIITNIETIYGQKLTNEELCDIFPIIEDYISHIKHNGEKYLELCDLAPYLYKNRSPVAQKIGSILLDNKNNVAFSIYEPESEETFDSEVIENWSIFQLNSKTFTKKCGSILIAGNFAEDRTALTNKLVNIMANKDITVIRPKHSEDIADVAKITADLKKEQLQREYEFDRTGVLKKEFKPKVLVLDYLTELMMHDSFKTVDQIKVDLLTLGNAQVGIFVILVCNRPIGSIIGTCLMSHIETKFVVGDLDTSLSELVFSKQLAMELAEGQTLVNFSNKFVMCDIEEIK